MLKASHYFFIPIIALGIISCGLGSKDKEAEDAIPPDDQYAMQGKVLAQTAGSALMSKLSQKITEKGIGGAITYCNLIAVPTLDSISDLYKATIRRVSQQYRNPLDQPDSLEAIVLTAYTSELEQGKTLKTQSIKDNKGEVRFFAPIFVQEFCLNCHGTPGKEISEINLSKIQELYPNDKAIGYKTGDLRGIWSIRFKK